MSTAQLATRPAPAALPTAPARPRGKTVALWVVMLGALCALPAFTTDMYLPGLPQVAADLGSTEAMAQLTVSCMLVGGGVGQLVIGPLSDRFGRRAPLLVGLVLHVVTSLLCVFVPTMSWLIALRLAQGFFNSAAATTAMAVVRDKFVGAEAARVLSRLMLVIGIAPMFAPTIGTAVLGYGSWRWVFFLLAAMGVALALIVLTVMPETHAPGNRTTGGPAKAFAGYRILLRDRQFLALAVVPGLAFGVLMSYVVTSPVVFQQQYGLTEGQFALLFGVNGVGLVLSAQVNAALVRRVAPLHLLRFGIVAQAIMTLLLLAVALTGAGGLTGLLVVLWGVLAFQGLIPPNASALAMSRHGEIAGTSAAMIGATQSMVAGIVSSLAGFLGSGAVAMSAVMLASVLGALAVLAFATPAFRKG
ncbi:multidrug effflux MFS transporter [Myceligenerans cantabricum]